MLIHVRTRTEFCSAESTPGRALTPGRQGGDRPRQQEDTEAVEKSQQTRSRWSHGVAAPLIAVALALTGCASSGDTAGGTSPPATPAPSETTSPAEPVVTSEIVGYWHRAQSCQELLTAFQAAGLAESHAGWLQGNFYGGGETWQRRPLRGCGRSLGALPLVHRRQRIRLARPGRGDGRWRRLRPRGLRHGDVSFTFRRVRLPRDIAVDFTVDEGIATFTVNIPDPCDASCQDAHAWALSAFASGPWAAGDIP